MFAIYALIVRVLVLEDEVDLGETVCDFLRARNCHAELVGDPSIAIHDVRNRHFDVFVVDVLLGAGIDGFQVCRGLRRDPAFRTPILMLTACDSLDDKLVGFEAGCDDYLTKPFDLPELWARLKALSQRQTTRSTILQVGTLTLDEGQQAVWREGNSVVLSESAFRLLTVLMRESPNVVDRERLERTLWSHRSPDSDALKTHMYYLRQQVDRPFRDSMIHTVRGRGYRIVAP